MVSPAQAGLGLTFKGQIAVRLANIRYSAAEIAQGKAAIDSLPEHGRQINRFLERATVVWDRWERMGRPVAAQKDALNMLRSAQRLRQSYERTRLELRTAFETALSQGWVTRDELERGTEGIFPRGMGDGGILTGPAVILIIVLSTILGAVLYAIFGIPRLVLAKAEREKLLIESNGYMAALNSRLDELPAEQVAPAIATVKSSGTTVQSPSFIELTTAGAAGGLVPILALGGILFLLSRRRR